MKAFICDHCRKVIGENEIAYQGEALINGNLVDNCDICSDCRARAKYVPDDKGSFIMWED